MTSWLPSEKGISLLQVLFFLLFLTISASVVMMNAPSMNRSGGSNITWERIDKIKDAVKSYRDSMGTNPATLDALSTAPAGAPACAPDTNPGSGTFRKLRGWCGPYLPRDATSSDLQKRDGWGGLLQYNGTTLVSCGPNRTCGDTDDITTAL